MKIEENVQNTERENNFPNFFLKKLNICIKFFHLAIKRLSNS